MCAYVHLAMSMYTSLTQSFIYFFYAGSTVFLDGKMCMYACMYTCMYVYV